MQPYRVVEIGVKRFQIGSDYSSNPRGFSATKAKKVYSEPKRYMIVESPDWNDNPIRTTIYDGGDPDFDRIYNQEIKKEVLRRNLETTKPPQ